MGQAHAHTGALSLFNELRAAFDLPALDEPALGAAAMRELAEAEPLLVMLAARVREPQVGSTLKDELRQAWNKALRRRGWSALPGLDTTVAPEPPRPLARPASAEEPAQLVAIFLACFGAAFDVEVARARVSVESMALAHALCVALLPEIDALRGLPLASPERYTTQFQSIVSRWNELARRRADLPALAPAPG